MRGFKVASFGKIIICNSNFLSVLISIEKFYIVSRIHQMFSPICFTNFSTNFSQFASWKRNTIHCVLRVLKTSRSCSWRQTYVFQSRIPQGIQIWVQHNQLSSLPQYYFLLWIILVYGHLVYLILMVHIGMRNLQYELRISQKSHNEVTITDYV